MKAAGRVGWQPFVMAFSIWFSHFMLCWAAVEIWPDQWRANQFAWGFTAAALLAMGVHFVRLERSVERGDLADFTGRIAHGAIAIATVAVLFSALPAVTILP